MMQDYRRPESFSSPSFSFSGGCMDFRRRTATLCAAALVFATGGCNGNNSTPAVAAGSSLAQLIHKKVKHIFVLVQENHTFDQYFGLYPGTPGQIVENLGSGTATALDCVPDPWAGACQRPFLITSNTANAAHY